MPNIPCKFWTKGHCFHGAECRFVHVDYQYQVPCPDYWDCNYRHCICRHPTEAEWDEYEQRIAEEERDREIAQAAAAVELAQREAEAQQKAAEDEVERQRRLDEVDRLVAAAMERRRAEIAEKQARKEKLVNLYNRRLARAATLIAQYQMKDEEQLIRDYQTVKQLSQHFANAVEMDPAVPAKRRRLANGRFAPHCPKIQVSEDYTWLKKVWMECIGGMGLWRPTLATTWEIVFQQYAEQIHWDEESPAFLEVFRMLFTVLLKYSNISDHGVDGILSFLAEDLEITSPPLIVCLLRYGFQLSSSDIIDLVASIYEYARNQNSTFENDPASTLIVTHKFSFPEIDRFIEQAVQCFSVEWLLGLPAAKAGQLIRQRYMDNEAGDFDSFEGCYKDVLELLEDVNDTPLFDRLYRATFDNHYSEQHYKVAMKNLENAPGNNLEWTFCDFDENLRGAYQEWKYYNRDDRSGYGGSDCSDSSMDSDEQNAVVNRIIAKATAEYEEEDRWYMRGLFW